MHACTMIKSGCTVGIGWLRLVSEVGYGEGHGRKAWLLCIVDGHVHMFVLLDGDCLMSA